MIGIYFSGTGNTKYCVEKFLSEYDINAPSFSIESLREEGAISNICTQDGIIMGYPVQYSNIPKILKDFITSHPDLWKNRKIFIIATMGLFSGDGAGILARLLHKYGAVITGGLHLQMPDSICDEKVLKRSLQKNRLLIKNADAKIQKAVCQYKNGNPPQEGLGIFCRLAGLFGQRLYFYHKTKNYSDKLKIDTGKCIGCGKCVHLCPMKNIQSEHKHAIAGNQCTMCYRCISHCPVQAITLLGKRVVEQCYIDKYL